MTTYDELERTYGCDFADSRTVGAEATADYCYAHQAFCADELPMELPPVPPTEGEREDDWSPWDHLPAALPHVELTPWGDRSTSDLPGWEPWNDADGRPLPVDP